MGPTTEMGVLAGAGAGNPDSEVVMDIPLDHLDYKYIGECTNVDELKNILRVLESGKEGRWFDLEKFCMKRLVEVLPSKEKKLFLAQRTEPSREEVQQASSDLADFLKDIGNRDEKLRNLKKKEMADNQIFDEQEDPAKSPNQGSSSGTAVHYPPVRGEEHAKVKTTQKPTYTVLSQEELEQSEAQKKSERLSGYDFRAWDKFDVDKELERIDQEEERLRKKREREIAVKQAEIDARKKATEKLKNEKTRLPVDVDSLAPEQRTFYSNQEKEKGNECFKAGEFDDALNFYTRSILFLGEPVEDARPFANRAMAYIKLERWEEAEIDCDRALEIDSSMTKAYARRGMARHRRGKYIDAIADFEEALHREPSNTKLNALLAESRKKYNEVGGIGADRPGAPPREYPETKKETFKKLMIMEDDSSDEEEEEEEEEVEVEVETVPETNDEPAQQEKGTKVESETWIEAKRKGAEEFKARNFHKALEWFSVAVSLLKKQQDETEHLCNCLGNQAVCYKELSQWEMVVSTCDEILSIEKTNIKALFRRALALENMGEYEKALNDMCQVLRLDPNRKEAGDHIPILMEKINNPPPQRKVEQVKVVEENPHADLEKLKEEGNALFKANQIKEALGKYEQCLAIDRTNLSVLSNKAMALLKLNRFEDCVACCTTALAQKKLDTNPIRTKLYYRRSQALQGLKKNLAALDDLENVAKLEPNNKRARSELEALKQLIKNEEDQQKKKVELERLKEKDEIAQKQNALTEKAKAKAREKVATNFSIPKSSSEFDRIWRSLDDQQRANYLTFIPSSKYKQIFKVELPEENLVQIAKILDTQQVESEQTWQILKALASINRFDTTLKFLSSKDKDTILRVINSLPKPHQDELLSLYQ